MALDDIDVLLFGQSFHLESSKLSQALPKYDVVTASGCAAYYSQSDAD
jgi:hypothetical protein